MRRLLFVVESGTDVRLVDQLARRFELTVLARRIEGGVEISQPPAERVEVIVGPAGRAAFAARAWREIRQRDVDTVLVQGYGPAALATNLASQRKRIPSTMLVCSPVERYYRARATHRDPAKPFRALELAGLTTFAVANAVAGTRYVVLSEHLRDEVQKRQNRGVIHVIPVYGVDTSVFRPSSADRTALRASRGLPRDEPVIFFSSRIAPEKDAETLLKAFRLLLDTGRPAWLLNRSGGHRAFADAARAAGVDHRVIATDAVHPTRELPLDYQAVDLLVQASREEGLGFSPLEALACGTPVVATAVGGLRETIIAGETGWTYPVGDFVSLAACLKEALDYPAEARRRADAGRAMVSARFEQQMVFDQLERVLLEGVRA